VWGNCLDLVRVASQTTRDRTGSRCIGYHIAVCSLTGRVLAQQHDMLRTRESSRASRDADALHVLVSVCKLACQCIGSFFGPCLQMVPYKIVSAPSGDAWVEVRVGSAGGDQGGIKGGIKGGSREESDRGRGSKGATQVERR
jgi:hypothetical protein